MADETTEAAVVERLVRQDVKQFDVDGHPIAVLHANQKIEDLEKFMTRPSRIEARMKVVDAVSFASYFNRFRNDNSLIVVNEKDRSVTAYLDYHGPSRPSWSTHSLSFSMQPTEEWQKWRANNGKRMDQVAFAEFIEDNMQDITSPDGAALLEVVMNMTSHRSARFASNIRLDNGQVQFTYEEEIKGKSSAGTIEIQQIIGLGIQMYRGGIMYFVDARLRYRVDEEKRGLSLWYDLKTPDRLEVDAFRKTVADITAQIVGVGVANVFYA